MTLLRVTDRGLYCEAGDFYVDPWAAGGPRGRHPRPRRPRRLGLPRLPHVRRPACRSCARGWADAARIRGVAYGEPVDVNGVRVSLHPAGHILGSAQVRVEHGGEVWVVSGDYKIEPDPPAPPFEPVRCHTFVTESHLRAADLPLAGAGAGVRRDQRLVARQPATPARPPLLFGYALGKAQRLLAGARPRDRPDPHPRRGRAR